MNSFIQKLLEKTSAWSLIAFITFAVQLYRRSYSDAIIFGLALFIIHFESTGIIDSWKFRGIKLSRFHLRIFIGASLLAIYLTNREETTLAIYFLLIAPLIFIFLWDGEPKHEKLNRLEIRSAVYWSFCGVAIATWEVLAIVLSIFFGDKSEFPTLSEIAAPVLSSPIERLQFAFIWLLSGYYIVVKWKKI